MTKKSLSPWRPMTNPVDISVLGKFGEELGEAGSAAARCLIQGINEVEPETFKPNKEWLEDEIADIFATASTAISHFELDWPRIEKRAAMKKARLLAWFALLEKSAGLGDGFVSIDFYPLDIFVRKLKFENGAEEWGYRSRNEEWLTITNMRFLIDPIAYLPLNAEDANIEI